MRMKQLFATSYQLIERTSTEFVRYLYNEIRWGNKADCYNSAVFRQNNAYAPVYQRALHCIQ